METEEGASTLLPSLIGFQETEFICTWSIWMLRNSPLSWIRALLASWLAWVHGVGACGLRMGVPRRGPHLANNEL